MAPQKAEYKVIQGNNSNHVGMELSGHAAQGWRPILMDTAAIGNVVLITVVLEHELVGDGQQSSGARRPDFHDPHA